MFIKVVWRITKSNVNNTCKPAGNQPASRASGKSSDEDNDDVIESFWLYIFSVFPSFVYYYLEETYVKLAFLCNIIYQKPKNSLVWEGRPNFSFLFKSCEILEVRGDLSINVEDKKSLRVDHQACKNYALALVLCAFNNSKSI